MYPCAVAELIVAARSLDIGGVADVIVWLLPGGGCAPKILLKAASRWAAAGWPRSGTGPPFAYGAPLGG